LERCVYRGYEIEPKREGSGWRVSVHPIRSDLPILHRSDLFACAPQKEAIIAVAKDRIDRLLTNLNT
jgi:hypothetical protein